MPKGAWLKEFESAEYRALCRRCRETIMPTQIPYYSGTCAFCWTLEQGKVFWANYFCTVVIECEQENNFSVTTRSATGRAFEVIERIFRRLEQPKRGEIYKAMAYAIKHARAKKTKHAALMPAWRRAVLAQLDSQYLCELKPKRVKHAEPVRKIKELPGQLSLFEGVKDDT